MFHNKWIRPDFGRFLPVPQRIYSKPLSVPFLAGSWGWGNRCKYTVTAARGRRCPVTLHCPQPAEVLILWLGTVGIFSAAVPADSLLTTPTGSALPPVGHSSPPWAVLRTNV